MKYQRWRLIFALSLLISSLLLYLFDYAVFKDPHEILTFMLGEIAFLPIEVLLVTLVVDRLLRYMERRNRLEKLNMVIGAFYVEVGTNLLAYLSDMDPNLEVVRSNLQVTSNWSREEFSRVARSLEEYNYKIDISRVDLMQLHVMLSRERDFFLRLIENPCFDGARILHRSAPGHLSSHGRAGQEALSGGFAKVGPGPSENRCREDLRAAG